jgi:hypothetical protein
MERHMHVHSPWESKKPSLLGIATPRAAKLKMSRVNWEAFTMTHYHIRWSGTESLDWECFSTSREAEASAERLVRQGETYTIEEHGEACPRCRTAMEAKSLPNTLKASA